MIVFSVAAAILAAHHFRRRSEGQHIGCHPDAGREFERVKAAARKGQLDEIGDPPLRRLGRFGDVDAVAAFFQRRPVVSGADRLQPKIAGNRVRRLPQRYSDRLRLSPDLNRPVGLEAP